LIACLWKRKYKEENIMSEFQEKRKSKRIGINVRLSCRRANNTLLPFGLKEEEFEVNVVNISKDGMAFRTNERLALNSFYDTQVVLWTKESFDTVIEIVRMENFGEEETLYGCRFVGISAADQFKIDVYQIVSEN